MRTSSWGYAIGTPLKAIKLPNRIAEAVQSVKARMSGDEFIKLLNKLSYDGVSSDDSIKLPNKRTTDSENNDSGLNGNPIKLLNNAAQDEWQKIPLSSVMRVAEILSTDPGNDGQYSLNDDPSFNPAGTEDMAAYREKVVKDTAMWKGDGRNEYVELIVGAYAEYISLAKPWLSILQSIDPLLDISTLCGSWPLIPLLFEYGLVFDDVDAEPATSNEVMQFTLGVESYTDTMDRCLSEAVTEDKPEIIAAVGLVNEATGKDRYQWLIEQRQKKLGKIDMNFLKWSEYPEYAALIHPLLPKVTSRESLEIIKACVDEIQFGAFGRAFISPEIQGRKEREAGNAFRQWWAVRKSSPDTTIILEEILGVDIDKLLALGYEQQECHKLLGIGGDASRADINKAYRKLAGKHHPDKGGSTEKMAEINQAKVDAMKAA